MRQIRKKQLAGVVAQALGAGVALSMFAAGALAQQAQKVEKIEVTGSNIKRVDTETIAPVEIITREDIERTGQASIADVLRNIPASVSGSFNESATNSFAPGATGLSLRGLGSKSTLVLINGRRTAGYGFAQNISDTFVDVNSIPSAAVERVEILKDGASALYGSDAIAGVVNIILRKDFKGAQAGVRVGRSEGKNDYRVTATGGFGDLAKDRYNFFGTFDYYKRDLLLRADTEFLRTSDLRGYEGGRNFTSLTGGGTWQQFTAAGAATTNYRAISECAGTVLTAAQAVQAGLLAPTSTANRPDNTFCSYDFAGQYAILPKTDRYGFLGRATFELSPSATGYVELGLNRTETFQPFQSTFFAGTTGLTQTGAGLRPFPFNVTFAPGVAGNPFASNARYVGVLNDMGTRDSDITSDTMRLLAGLTYVLGKWDLDSAVGFSKNKIESMSLNRLSLSGTTTALGITTTPQPPVPVSTSSLYNADRWSTNPEAVRQAMQIDFPRKAESELAYVDTKGSTEIGRLPGGPVGLAVGAEFRNEKLKDSPDPRAQGGDVLGQGITATNGKRDSTAVYAELALPITQQLEAQLAGRFDHYSDYGSSTNPKVGFKFRPSGSVLLRANWGKGFRAPTLPEISPSTATFFTTVIDPLDGSVARISGVYAGNPDLKAEKSTSTTAGIVIEPTRDFSIGLGYYRLDWKDIVSSPTVQSVVNGTGAGTVIRDPETGAITTVITNYTNLSSVKTSGVDLDVKYTASSSIGKFTTRANLTYVDSFKEEGDEYAGTNGGSNTYPRTRGILGLDWDYQGWSFTANVNYIRGYYQVFLPGSYYTPSPTQNGVYPERISHYRTLDLFGRYQVNKNISVTASVINVEGTKPPYDPAWSTFFDYTLYDVRGRQIRLGLSYEM